MNQRARGVELAAKRPGPLTRWFFRVLAAVHSALYRRGGGRSMGKMQQILLTTTGRKSGKRHTVPVGAIPEGNGWVVIGSFNGFDVHPNWWLNLVARPQATIQVNDRVLPVRMEEITDPADRERLWSQAVARVPRYATYSKKTSRVIPLGLLRPVS